MMGSIIVQSANLTILLPFLDKEFEFLVRTMLSINNVLSLLFKAVNSLTIIIIKIFLCRCVKVILSKNEQPFQW